VNLSPILCAANFHPENGWKSVTHDNRHPTLEATAESTKAAPSHIRIVLLDDHQVLLQALAERLERAPGIEVAGTATNADEGLRLILETSPDIAIIDVELPGRGSFEVVAELQARRRTTRVMFLTGYLSDVFIEHALRRKARAYLLKSDPIESLLANINGVARGEFRFSQEVLERLRFDPSKNRYCLRTENRLSSLTQRQLEVMRHLAKGQSVKEVAKAMHLSEKSVDSHKYRIMHKLGIHDRVELARYAIREGLALP
jgi:DNA-binding NarL/FixJ family response regulator